MNYRKLLVFVLSIVLLFQCNVFASDSIALVNSNDRDTSKNDEIIAVYRMTNEGPVQVSLKDYYQYLASQQNITYNKQLEIQEPIVSNQLTTLVPGVPVTFYSESGSIAEVHRTSLTTRISTILQNTTTLPITRTLSGSKTQTSSASISLTTTDKSAIQAETGINYSTSYNFSDSVTVTIPAGYQSWMEFYPIMRNSYGYLQYGVTTDLYPYYTIYSQKFTDIYFPRELANGQLDGVYIIKQSTIS